MRDKGGKGKPKDSQTASNDTSKAKKKNIKCWYCEVMGNTAKECRKKKPDLKRKNEASAANPKSKSANVTTGEVFLTKYYFTYTVIAGEQGRYVDSGASKLMLNTREWFQTLEAVLAESKVTMGDNCMCPVKGIGRDSICHQK